MVEGFLAEIAAHVERTCPVCRSGPPTPSRGIFQPRDPSARHPVEVGDIGVDALRSVSTCLGLGECALTDNGVGCDPLLSVFVSDG